MGLTCRWMLNCLPDRNRAWRRAVDPGEAARAATVSYGYTGHVMDFPGTINNHFEHSSIICVSISQKSLAYHGFKKDRAAERAARTWRISIWSARRTNLETDAECILAACGNLLNGGQGFLPPLAAK